MKLFCYKSGYYKRSYSPFITVRLTPILTLNLINPTGNQIHQIYYETFGTSVLKEACKEYHA